MEKFLVLKRKKTFQAVNSFQIQTLDSGIYSPLTQLKFYLTEFSYLVELVCFQNSMGLVP